MSKGMKLKAQIKKLAQEHHLPAQAILQNFIFERLLERITLSKHQNNLIIKGGLLIGALVGIQNRTTMDLDTTLQGMPLTHDQIEQIFTEICAIELEDDLSLSLNSIKPIRNNDDYGGFRVSVSTQYERIQTPIKIDITTGDAITPAPQRYIFISNFDGNPIELWAYNIETILAEKVETILRRTVFNTRPRDFYDVYILQKKYHDEIDIPLFQTALQATAENRQSQSILLNYKEIMHSIEHDKGLQKRWSQYSKDNFYASQISYFDLIQSLHQILNIAPAEGTIGH